MYQCERRMFLRYLAKETSNTGVERTALPLVRAWNVSASWSNSDSSEAPPNRPPIIIVRLHLARRFPGIRLEGIGTCVVNVCVCVGRVNKIHQICYQTFKIYSWTIFALQSDSCSPKLAEAASERERGTSEQKFGFLPPSSSAALSQDTTSLEGDVCHPGQKLRGKGDDSYSITVALGFSTRTTYSHTCVFTATGRKKISPNASKEYRLAWSAFHSHM